MKEVSINLRVNPDKLRRHYKNQSSGYRQWDQKSHADEYLIFPENIGSKLSIDEVALAKGELYTFVTNKAGHGKQGSLVAVINGTKSENIYQVLSKIPESERCRVEEITLDMANNMESASRRAFPLAKLVTDRFHVVRLATEALQHIRVKYRWDAIDQENQAIADARKKGMRYSPDRFTNGDTVKELLARSRHLVTKLPDKWTDAQKLRASILFKEFPEIEKAYWHVVRFRNIYTITNKSTAKKLFRQWIWHTNTLNIKEFFSVANTLNSHFDSIVNFFDNRSTNAAAESFNSKIKLFRANQRGVVDNKFFLFRIMKLFA